MTQENKPQIKSVYGTSTEIGIERLEKLASYPVGEVSDYIRRPFNKIAEFFTFIEFVWLPFYSKVLEFTEKKKCSDFECQNITGKLLTYDEAFSFLRYKVSVGMKEGHQPAHTAHSILDDYNKFSVPTYNRLFHAIKWGGGDKEFCSAIDNGDKDDQNFLKFLYPQFYFINRIYNDVKIKEPPVIGHWYDNANLRNDYTFWQWRNGLNNISVFYDWEGNDMYSFMNMVIGPITNGRQPTYGGYNIKNFDNVSVYDESDEYEYQCRLRYFHNYETMYSKHLCETFKVTHPVSTDSIPKITNTIGGQYYSGWLKEAEEAFSDLSVQSKSLIHVAKNEEKIVKYCTETVARYIKGICTRAYNSYEDICMNHIPNHYEETFSEHLDSNMFIDYILLYTKKMLNLYNELECVLSDEEKEKLKWILNNSKYTKLFANMATEDAKDNVYTAEKPSVSEEDAISDRSNPPTGITQISRFKTERLKTLFCQNIQDYFIDANVNELTYVFFKIGDPPTKKLVFRAKLKDACKIISYIFTQKIKKETWAWFGSFINYEDKPIFPKDIEDYGKGKPYPSGYASPEEKEEFKIDMNDSIKRKIKDITEDEIKQLDL